MSNERVGSRRAANDGWRVAIAAVSAAYLVIATVGTWISVRDGLVGTPLGWDLGLEPLPSFLFGLGTALAAPLWSLVALVAVNLVIWFRGDLRRGALSAMILLASGLLIGMLAEPITWDLFRGTPVDALTTGIIIANILLPIILVIVAVRARMIDSAAIEEPAAQR